MSFLRIAAAVCITAAVGACMGRAPQPVATVQPQDQMMNCTAIYAEIQSNNHRIEELGREKGWKTAQNVAAGVGGLVIPVLWFGMDWQGAAGTEAERYRIVSLTSVRLPFRSTAEVRHHPRRDGES